MLLADSAPLVARFARSLFPLCFRPVSGLLPACFDRVWCQGTPLKPLPPNPSATLSLRGLGLSAGSLMRVWKSVKTQEIKRHGRAIGQGLSHTPRPHGRGQGGLNPRSAKAEKCEMKETTEVPSAICHDRWDLGTIEPHLGGCAGWWGV